jgi:ABC-type antimicrobial peptide transport system permease subunit
MVKDTYAANIVLAELEALEYNAIYPSNIGNQFEEVLQLINNIWFGVLMSLVMGVIYIISYNVLKLVQNSKKKDYLIFRSIGASKKDLNKVTILELFYTVALGYIVTMILLFVNEQFDTFLPQYLRFFTVWSYLLIFIVLSILSLLLGRSFNKRIFSKSVITSLKQEV